MNTYHIGWPFIRETWTNGSHPSPIPKALAYAESIRIHSYLTKGHLVFARASKTAIDYLWLVDMGTARISRWYFVRISQSRTSNKQSVEGNRACHFPCKDIIKARSRQAAERLPSGMAGGQVPPRPPCMFVRVSLVVLQIVFLWARLPGP